MTIDQVENLIKKHEAFEKSATAQEERFSALERLTTVRYNNKIYLLLCFQHLKTTKNICFYSLN